MKEREEISRLKEEYRSLCDVPPKDYYANGVKMKPCGIKYKEKVTCVKCGNCNYYMEFHGEWVR